MSRNELRKMKRVIELIGSGKEVLKLNWYTVIHVERN